METHTDYLATRTVPVQAKAPVRRGVNSSLIAPRYSRYFLCRGRRISAADSKSKTELCHCVSSSAKRRDIAREFLPLSVALRLFFFLCATFFKLHDPLYEGDKAFMAATESILENNIIRNRDQLGYADALCIRRVRVGRGFGEVDLMLLPRRGPHRFVLVEAKLGKSPDARAKVIGKLLWYYAGALALGTHGLNLLRQLASSTPLVARSATRKGLKTLTGG